LPWKSCEHALDAWFAFTRIGGLEEEAEKVKQWLLQEAWNQQEQRFNRGENDPVIATDCQSWGAIWLVFQGDQAKARQSLAFAEAHLATQDTFNGHLMHGFPAQSSAPQVIWAEGTAQMVVAYAYVGMATPRDYLEELTSIQNADGSWNHSSQNLSQPEVWHSTMESVAGTCWTYFAICAKNEGLYVPFGEPVKQ
jgi:hypothetical protein